MPLLPRLRFGLLLLTGIALVSGAARLYAAEGQLLPLNGKPVSAKLAALDTQLQAIFELAGGEARSLAPGEFVAWGARREMTRGLLILLVDGSILAGGELPPSEEKGTEVRLADDRLILKTGIWGERPDPFKAAQFAIPINRVRGLLLHAPPEAAARDRLLDELADAKGDDDRVWLDNGDLLSGTLLPAADPKLPAGAAGPPARPAAELAPAALRLEVKGGRDTKPLSIPWGKVRGIRFSPALAALPPEKPAAMLVGLADGSSLRVKELRAPGADQLEVVLLGGLTLPVGSLTDLPAEIVSLRGSQASVTWLSDLEPQGYRHWPYLSGEWNLGRDRSAAGGRLRVGGRLYDKGLGMHSRSRVIYDLPDGAARFEAEVAVDDAADGRGSVIFRVFTGDGDGFQPALETPVVRGGDSPRAISVDLKGAKQVALVVEYADRGDERDHADWLMARFVK